MLEWLFGKKKEPKQRQMHVTVNAAYDTARKTLENQRHWNWVDYLDADASMVFEVRNTIRAQARYEAHQNNSYAHGICRDFVRDVVGTGPRLQMEHVSERVNVQVEAAFGQWMLARNMAQKLFTKRLAKLIDGESLGLFTNSWLYNDPVSLDLKLLECDHLSSPRRSVEITPTYVDGVHLDLQGNPVAYDILDRHPGNGYYLGIDPYAFTTYPRARIIHDFKIDRPGQHRGISQIASALPLFAFARRYTLATISAAETAANVSQVITTDAPLPEELEEEYAVSTFEKYMEAVPVDRNSATVLPNQWDMKQFKAEHPTTTYRMFKREIIAEIARCVSMPGVIAGLDASEHNFASARLDRMTYEKVIEGDQSEFERCVVDKLFAEWLYEASLLGEIPTRLGNEVINLYQSLGPTGVAARIPHSWFWDGFKTADQKDTADAQRVALGSGTTHRAREYAKQGLDVEVEDQKAADSFGLTVEEYRKALMSQIFTNGNMFGEEQNESSGAESPATSSSEE